MVCHTSKQHRYFETHRQGGFAVPVPGAAGNPICLPSRDTGALSNTSLHYYLSPLFVLEQSAPTLIGNFQCLVRSPQSSLHVSPSTPQEYCLQSFSSLRTRDFVQSSHSKNLPSHIHTLQKSPRKLHLPKREMQPTPQNKSEFRETHTGFFLSFPLLKCNLQNSSNSQHHRIGDSCEWLCAWSPPCRAAPVLPTITIFSRDPRDAQTTAQLIGTPMHHPRWAPICSDSHLTTQLFDPIYVVLKIFS